MSRKVGLGLDEHGWVTQQKGRDAYEVAKEPVQNSMDTGSDIDVRVGYGDNYIVVEDDHPEGVQDLEHFHKVFSGDKRDVHDKRGRFGRGTKELLAAADRTVVKTTGGTAIFEVNQNDEGRYNFSGEVYDDITSNSGTYIFAKCEDWTDEQLEEFHEFVGDIIVPQGTEMEIEYVDRSEDKPERKSDIMSPREPEAILDGEAENGVMLNTVVYEDGRKSNPIEPTTVEVYHTEQGDGGISEMGIPITQDEDFPYIFNVQQRTPVAEQRDTIDDSYRNNLMQALINEKLELLEDDELSQEYVTSHLSSSTWEINKEVQKEYIDRRWGSPERLLLTTEDTSSYAIDRAQQLKTDLEKMVDVSDLSFTVKQILTNHVETADAWVDRRNEEESTEILEPTEEQQEFMDRVYSELVSRSRVWGVDQQMAEISGGEGAGTRARHQGSTVTYNVLSEDWEEFNPRNVGTVVHELAHHESSTSSHGEDWYGELANIAGEVIVDQQEEINQMEDEIRDLREEKGAKPVDTVNRATNETKEEGMDEQLDEEESGYIERVSEWMPF